MGETLKLYILSPDAFRHVPTEAMLLALHKTEIQGQLCYYFTASDRGACDYSIHEMTEEEEDWLSQNTQILCLR